MSNEVMVRHAWAVMDGDVQKALVYFDDSVIVALEDRGIVTDEKVLTALRGNYMFLNLSQKYNVKDNSLVNRSIAHLKVLLMSDIPDLIFENDIATRVAVDMARGGKPLFLTDLFKVDDSLTVSDRVSYLEDGFSEGAILTPYDIETLEGEVLSPTLFDEEEYTIEDKHFNVSRMVASMSTDSSSVITIGSERYGRMAPSEHSWTLLKRVEKYLKNKPDEDLMVDMDLAFYHAVLKGVSGVNFIFEDKVFAEELQIALKRVRGRYTSSFAEPVLKDFKKLNNREV